MTAEEKSAKRILVAEDDPVTRRLLQGLLEKWGFEVISAVDGAAAAKCLEGEDAPVLAVLDWMMPGVEGPELCRRVRARQDRPYTYILLLTGRNQKEDISRGLEWGADDYLIKPFDPQELRARLHVGQRILNLQDNLIAATEKLRFQATHDPLTGVANHREIVEAIERESARQAREGGSFGIILLDLDHFKGVNDCHGHLAGDAVLQEVARRVTRCVRPYDTVGRYGGEEFLVVAPSTDGSSLLKLADRIREAIRAAAFDTGAGAIQVTVSCGVCVGGSGQPLDSQVLIQSADEALYRAKELGRNRCELAKPSESGESRSPNPVSVGPASHKPLNTRS